MKWKLSVGLVVIGFVTLVGGLGYGLITFGGIPTPDAPPQIRAAEDHYAQVAGSFMLAGLVLLSVGVVVIVGCLLHRLWNRG